MTPAGQCQRAVSDPVELIADLVAAVEREMNPGQIHAVVTSVAGGRAKSRRLAAALVERPEVLTDGRSPAPRAIGDLLIALRKAGASSVSPPCCAECGKALRTLQRRGQDWYCAVCEQHTEPCAACGNTRAVSSRDRAGEPRCGKCPDIDGRDPITVIHNIIVGLAPHVDRETIATAVRGSAPQPAYQQKLAWALQAHPALLTGDGHLASLRAIPRLIDLLHSANVAGIVRPTCPGCRRVVRIDKPLGGMRVCRMCIAHSRVEKCSRCGARREPATRDTNGQPLCPNCLITDPDNLETCINCGRRRAVCTRTSQGPLCGSCPTLLPATCSICSRKTPCGTSRITGLPWCPGCQRRLATCSACSRDAAIASGTVDRPLCADCTAPPTWIRCPACSDPDYPHPGQCARCLIDKRLDEVMGPASTLVPGLQALRRNIATTEHPITAMRWLTKRSVVPILSDLTGGRTPLTHEALDELPDSPALSHLRQTLVSVGALPERDEEMARLEQFLTEFIASQQNSDRRKTLHRYVLWNLVRRVRGRNNDRRTSRQQSLRVRSHARAAVAFLDWLERNERTLGSCRQADLDQWLIDETGAYRIETGTFIRWAHANNLTTVYIGAKRWNGPTDPLDDQHRWDTARRLLHDDTLKAEHRLAGLLLLLYAQGPSTISRLTVEHLHLDDHGARIYLGRAPIHLPEPVAELARLVVANRKGHATIGALTPSPWLFPGGQPGRPISTARLTLKLNRLGISPNQARSTALFQLATEIPAAILARTLGIHTDAAVRWQRLSAGDWATYAAEVSRRTTEPDRHSDSLNI